MSWDNLSAFTIFFAKADRPLSTHRGHIARLNRYALPVDEQSAFGREKRNGKNATSCPTKALAGSCHRLNDAKQRHLGKWMPHSLLPSGSRK